MFKSKGVIAGVAATLVASTLLLAGLTISTTTGAATDFGGAPSGDLTVTDPGSPPASPIEQPIQPGTGTQPTSPNPSGAPAGGTGAPGSLPSAGFGESGSNSFATFIALVGMAGAVMIGAGATVVTANRRK